GEDRRRGLSDGLPVALRLRAVRARRPERAAGADGDGRAPLLRGVAARLEGTARAVAAGLLARPYVYVRRRRRADRRGAVARDPRLHALEPARRLHVACALAPFLNPLYSAIRYSEAVAATRAIQLRTEIPGPRSRAILER